MIRHVSNWLLTSLFFTATLLSGFSFAGYTFQLTLSPGSGQGGNGNSITPSISADGGIVAFESVANDLVASDTNSSSDVFVKDLWAGGQITRVSVNSSGKQGNSYSRSAQISSDGRFVVFVSGATNLVTNDTNDLPDIFVHDNQLHTTTRVNVDSNGNQAVNPPPNPPYNSYGGSDNPRISADGRIIVFESYAANLTSDDYNKQKDIFVHDLATRKTTRVILPVEPLRHCLYLGSISADGRYIAFSSCDDGIVLADNNRMADVFVYDRQTKTTNIVSVDSTGAIVPYNSWGSSYGPSISADGRYVAFASFNTLVPSPNNIRPNVYVYDFVTRQIVLMNTDNYYASDPAISANGASIAYRSWDPLAGTDNYFIKNRLSTSATRIVLPPNLQHKTACPWCKIGILALNADGTIRTFATDFMVAVNGGALPAYTQDTFWRDSTSINAIPEDYELKLTQQVLNIKLNTEASFTYSVTNLGDNPASLRFYHVVNNGLVTKLLASQGSCTRYSLISLCNLGIIASKASQTVQIIVKATRNASLAQQTSIYSTTATDVYLSNNRKVLVTPVVP